MTTETRIDGGTLTVRRIYDAPAADVFDAWIDAGKTSHWWGCAQTTRVDSVIDPRIGGAYRHDMTLGGIGQFLIAGTFIAYDPPRTLAYRTPGMSEGETMEIHVDFAEADDKTTVTLTQTRIPEPFTGEVSGGWTAAFERLAWFFAGERRAA